VLAAVVTPKCSEGRPESSIRFVHAMKFVSRRFMIARCMLSDIVKRRSFRIVVRSDELRATDILGALDRTPFADRSRSKLVFLSVPKPIGLKAHALRAKGVTAEVSGH